MLEQQSNSRYRVFLIFSLNSNAFNGPWKDFAYWLCSQSKWVIWKLDKAIGYKRIPRKTFRSIPGKNCKENWKKIVEQNGKIKELQSKVVTKDNAYQKLEIKCNDIEQCICRLCMLIHGVEYNENDDVMNIMNKAEKLLWWNRCRIWSEWERQGISYW